MVGVFNKSRMQIIGMSFSKQKFIISVTDDDISVAFYSNKTDSKEASFQDNPTFKLFRAQIRFSNIIHASQVKL